MMEEYRGFEKDEFLLVADGTNEAGQTLWTSAVVIKVVSVLCPCADNLFVALATGEEKWIMANSANIRFTNQAHKNSRLIP